MVKKLLALTLVLAFVFSLAGCNTEPTKTKPEDPSKSLPPINELLNEISERGDEFDYIASKLESDLPETFEDFKDIIDRDFSVKTKTDKDGNIKIELNLPTTDDDVAAPAIPTIENLPVKPLEKEEPENEDTASKDTEFEFEIEIEIEIEPEPTPEPEKEDTDSSESVETPAPEQNQEAPQEPQEDITQTKPQYTYTTGQIHNAVPVTERYLYSLLDEKHKKTYMAIDKAVRNLDETVRINYKLSENREYMIYYLYMFDNPELFYLANTTGICSNLDGTSDFRFCYSVGKEVGEKCGYGYGELTEELKTKIRNKKAIFDAEVKRITSTIPKDAPDVVKEKLIYDRILLDSFYNLSARWDGLANDNWTAYGIIVNKYGVCESYAEAFQTLCLAVGINCTGVVGTAGGGHKWNAVKLDGEWYMCDITFDDPIGGEPNEAYHYYFNLTSERMSELMHDWSNSEYPVPNCTATKYSYQNYFE